MIDAARHGAIAIRRHQNVVVQVQEPAGSVVLQYKQAGDARSALTAADLAAQRVVCASLQRLYPSLHIVGEEDDTVVLKDTDAVGLRTGLALDFTQDCCSSSSSSSTLPPEERLDWNEITLFVDPLDGTREFVEGRLSNVQCLIGLTHRGRPLLGAIGLPFVDAGDDDDDGGDPGVQVVYGWVGRGVGRMQEESIPTEQTTPTTTTPRLVPVDPGSFQPFDPNNSPFTLSSGDSTSPLLVNAVKVIKQLFPTVQREIQGACGNKILRVAHNTVTPLAVMHHKTCLWDTAAPSAILMALGGTVTDLFGQPLLYTGFKRELGNTLGVLCSAPGAQSLHATICEAMRADSHVLQATVPQIHSPGDDDDSNTGQCVDIVRDVDGFPLPTSVFAQHVGGTPPLSSYTCPERESVRGLMSNACRVYLHPTSSEERTVSAFYKRIDFAQLDHARDKLVNAPHKLLRDVKSYRVETSFLSSAACGQVIEQTGIRIPACYHAKLLPNDDNPIESKFSILLQDFAPSNDWSQRWLLRKKEECHATLRTFAKMHAFFWKGSQFWTQQGNEAAAQQLVDSVWESASYVQPALQTKHQCQQVQSSWLQKREQCRPELQDFEWWDTLGIRLERVAQQVGHEAHPFHPESIPTGEYDAYKTLIHGDPKQTNIFFRQEETDSSSSLAVGLIDFQWAGFGLAASDIAHHLVAAVHADLLQGDGESELLQYYYDQLTAFLVEYGAYTSVEEVHADYSFDGVFLRQYETAVLDLCRLVIAYAWSRFERLADDDDDAAGFFARTMNKNSYNKSVPNVIWLMQRCDALLKQRETV